MRGWFVLGLVACGTSDRDQTPDPTDAAADDTPLDVPEDNIARQLGDCADRYRTPPAYPNQLGSGDELARLTLDAPNAVCNDGTPAVLYVRPWTDPSMSDVWSIHLQGGGACASWASCVERWCGIGYYDSSKMSSVNLPDHVDGFGIYDAAPENGLAGANQVMFYYCSSDSWGGQGSATFAPPEDLSALPPIAAELGDLPTYTMPRRGHDILAAGIDALLAGATADDATEMPPLTEASKVVFSGTSAGSTGASGHADWLSARLAPHGTSVVAIFDAAITPRMASLSATMQADLAALYAEDEDRWSGVLDAPDWVDESCPARVAADAPSWQCGDQTYVMLNHITTPFFVRQDFRDIGERMVRIGITEDQHEAAVRDTLLALQDLSETAVEADAMRRGPGAFGPNCGQHVALESTRWWLENTIVDRNGTPRNYQGAFAGWEAGSTVVLVDEVTAGPGDGPRSGCPNPDPNR